MNEFTEDDVPISCGECSIYLTGLGAMIAHVLKKHKQYSSAEAIIYANKWMEDAFESVNQQAADYATEMRERR